MGLGDDIMALGSAVRMHAESGRKVVIGPPGSRYWSPMFHHAHCLVSPEEPELDCQRLYDYPGQRPYINYRECRAGKQVLHESFRAQAGALFFSEFENQNAQRWLEDHAMETGFILVEPHVKATFSGTNKLWPWNNWCQLVGAFAERGETVVQASRPGGNVLPHVSAVIRDQDVRRSLALLRYARCVVTTDGLFHHAAAALHVPAVVIWGARTNPEILGYKQHSNMTYGDDWCGSLKQTCAHCQRAMSRIEPGRVWFAVEQMKCGTPVK